jgi:hypothetical protein
MKELENIVFPNFVRCTKEKIIYYLRTSLFQGYTPPKLDGVSVDFLLWLYYKNRGMWQRCYDDTRICVIPKITDAELSMIPQEINIHPSSVFRENPPEFTKNTSAAQSLLGSWEGGPATMKQFCIHPDLTMRFLNEVKDTAHFLDIDWYILTKNRALDPDDILKEVEFPWCLDAFYSRLDIPFSAVKQNLQIHKKYIKWDNITQSAAISAKTILDNPDYPWDMDALLLNPTFRWDDIFCRLVFLNIEALCHNNFENDGILLSIQRRFLKKRDSTTLFRILPLDVILLLCKYLGEI